MILRLQKFLIRNKTDTREKFLFFHKGLKNSTKILQDFTDIRTTTLQTRK